MLSIAVLYSIHCDTQEPSTQFAYNAFLFAMLVIFFGKGRGGGGDGIV